MDEKPDQPAHSPSPLEVIVVDPHNAPVQYVDWIVTGGVGPALGTINVVLAAVDYAITTEGKPQAIGQTRLRMSLTAAANLHRFPGGILFAATPAPPVQATSLN
jgi:hypothetical protein